MFGNLWQWAAAQFVQHDLTKASVVAGVRTPPVAAVHATAELDVNAAARKKHVPIFVAAEADTV